MNRTALFFFLILISGLVSAQPGPVQPERLSDEKIVSMQSQDLARWLELKGKVRARFVETYSSFRQEIDEVSKSAVPAQNVQTESDIEKMLLGNFSVSRKILDIRQKYFKIFREFLKPSQIRQMYALENESGKRMREASMRPDGAPDQAEPSRPDGPSRPGGMMPPPPSGGGNGPMPPPYGDGPMPPQDGS